MMKDDSESYYDTQEFKDLLKLFEDMLNNGDSTYFDGMDIANIIEYYSISNDTDKSEAALRYGLSLHPNDPDILIAKANSLLSKGNKNAARIVAESIDDTNNQELLYLKGEIELSDDNIDKADIFFTQAVEKSDEDPGMINDIIVQYMDNRHYKHAQRWLDKAYLKSPDSRNFIELQADLYFDTNNTDMAIESYNRLLDDFPYDTYYWEQLGRIYFEKENFPKAKECYEFIEAIDDTNKSAKMIKAECVLQMEDWAEAKRLFEVILTEDPDSPSLLYYCGQCRYELEEYEDALIYFLRSLHNLNEANAEEVYLEIYIVITRLLLKLNRKKEAEQYLYLGLALEPENEDLKTLKSELDNQNPQNK